MNLNKAKSNIRIGIDIGGVVISRGSDSDDTSFDSENFLKTPPVANAFKSIRTLKEKGASVFLISKAKEETRKKTEQWFGAWDFFRKTGVVKSNVYFCLERSEKPRKALELKLTHFVDDRLEILGNMPPSVVERFLFCPELEEIYEFQKFLPSVKLVLKWKHVLEDIYKDY